MKKPKVIMLQWKDSASNSGWISPSESNTAEVLSIGIFLYETKDRVAISTSVAWGGEDAIDVLCIPKSCITSRRWIKI